MQTWGAYWGVLAAVFLLTLHPITAEDFWWHQSRGRSVTEWHLAPARTLLAGVSENESDWLGGVPFYLLAELVGTTGTCWLLAVSGAVGAGLLLRQGHPLPIAWRCLLVFFGCATIRLGWQPVSGAFDIIGVAAIWGLSTRYLKHPSRSRLLLVGAVAALWGNLGSLCLLAVPVVGTRVWQMVLREELQIRPLRFGSLLAVVVTCCSFTPRGVFTLWDSLRLLIPWFWLDLGTLQAAEMLTPLNWPPSAEAMAFLVLSGLVALLIGRSRPHELASTIPFLVMQILAWTVRANLPAIGIWLTLYGLQLSSVERKTAASDKRPQPEQVPNGLRWVMIVVFLFGFTVGVGAWPGSTTRCGWGLSPDLELSLLQHALADLPLDGSSHCSGVRESGMLAWLRPGEIRPYDVPERAFLAGRLKEHVRISDDLRAGWADRHRRGDGTWGGWWIPLAQRNTRLLLISPRDTECVRSLESSNWKPLAIDAPCLPYGLAGDPALGNRMVQMLALLDLVEHGAWSYPAPPAGGAGHYVDLCGWFTGQHNVQLDLQQSRTMEAMQRHLAAIRVLQYALQRSCQEAREAYQRNQLALAYQEQLQVGRASRWRTLAYLGSGGNIKTAVELFGSETLPPSSDPTTRNWQQAVKAALAGDLQSAIKELPEHEDESLYAKSQLYLEAGEPARAAALFRRLIVEFPESMCATLARTTLGLRHE